MAPSCFCVTEGQSETCSKGTLGTRTPQHSGDSPGFMLLSGVCEEMGTPVSLAAVPGSCLVSLACGSQPVLWEDWRAELCTAVRAPCF